jgi:tripartite-type tricarboxylate transporter receptor subunit TctC
VMILNLVKAAPLKFVATTIVATCWLAAAHAQSVAEFYKGKAVDVYIGTSVGGGYDTYARVLSRHIGKYIPGNPSVVPKNMEGGGGMRLANFLYNAANKDGSTFGIFNRGIGFDQLLGSKSAQFDATKFSWVGSTNNEISVCVAWHTTGVTRWQDMLTQELVVGASGPAADTFQFPKIANGVLGTKFKIISGYPGGNDIDLAMERGEVQGRCGWSWTAVKATHQPWLDQKKINILFQMGLSKHADLPNVPLIVELAKTDEDRAIFKMIFARQVMAWPFAAPPGVPKDRADALRKAFMDTMKDKDFLAEASKANLDINPVPGDEIQKLVVDIYGTPAPVVQKALQHLQ